MSAIPADLRATSPWRTALPALLTLLALVVLLYRETATTMVGIWWRSETFAHAFLVLPISLWLIWRQRERLTLIQPRPWPWALALMLAVCAAWLLADLVVVGAATQFAFVALLILCVPAVLGIEFALAILFPLLFLFFAVPFGEFMLPPMMEWTADFVVRALQLTGVPVFREGLQFVIPSGNWSVIDECSGVRYLIASFMVGNLFAYLNYRSYARRIAFMAVALLVPIVANWLRAYIIVMMGHLSGNRLAVGVDHILYGWVFFGIVIFVMFMVGARWSEPDEPPVGNNAGNAGNARTRADSAAKFTPAIAVVLAALVLAIPQLALSALKRTESQVEAPQMELPLQLPGGWTTENARIVDWRPVFNNPSVEAARAYAGKVGTVGAYLAFYRGQDLDRKLVSSRNGVLGINDRVWNRVGTGLYEARSGDVTTTFITTEVLGPTSAGLARRPHLMVWNVYWIDGQWVHGEITAKLVNALARLRGRGDDGAALVLYADEATPAASTAALEAFVAANLPTIKALLQTVRDKR